MAKDLLSSPSHAERQAALEAARQAIAAEAERTRSDLRARIAAADASASRQVADAERQAAATRAELAAALVRSFYDKAAPVITDWMQVPTRSLAGQLAELFAAHDARAREQLGEPLQQELLAYAFCDAIMIEQAAAINAFGDYHGEFGGLTVGADRVVERVAKVVQAFPRGLPATYDALIALEGVLADVAAVTTARGGAPLPDAQARYRARRNAATRAGAVLAVAALDEQERAATRTTNAVTPHSGPGPWLIV